MFPADHRKQPGRRAWRKKKKKKKLKGRSVKRSPLFARHHAGFPSGSLNWSVKMQSGRNGRMPTKFGTATDLAEPPGFTRRNEQIE